MALQDKINGLHNQATYFSDGSTRYGYRTIVAESNRSKASMKIETQFNLQVLDEDLVCDLIDAQTTLMKLFATYLKTQKRRDQGNALAEVEKDIA